MPRSDASNDGLKEGDLFAGYTIVRLLGAGGMGEVYLAQHPRLPRQDALKVLPAGLTANDEYRQRFNREAELAAGLSHPHIVGIHDRGEFQGQLWISMDYVAGTDAARLLRNRYTSGMPAAEVFEIVSAVADALDYAHSRGLLHRDVKPANILLGDSSPRGRRISLTDFGIARQFGDASDLTATNMVLGTTAYCAPEQLQGADIDGRADQYALGCTAYHLLTGSAPFQDPNPAVVISRHMSAPPPLISERRPELAALNAVIARALAKDPNDRYPSCAEFAATLDGRRDAAPTEALATTPAIPRSAPTRRRALRPATLIAAAAAVLVIAVAVVVGVQLPHLLGGHAHQPSNGAVPTSTAEATGGNPAAPVSATVQLSRYITDQGGVLGPVEHAEVDRALNNLYAARNIHLWVVYVNNFSGRTPLQWAEQTMRANQLPDTEALLAIATDDRTFSFRVPETLTEGTGTDVEAIRRNRIRPAVRQAEWARAAISAAVGLATVAP